MQTPNKPPRGPAGPYNVPTPNYDENDYDEGFEEDVVDDDNDVDEMAKLQQALNKEKTKA